MQCIGKYQIQYCTKLLQYHRSHTMRNIPICDCIPHTPTYYTFINITTQHLPQLYQVLTKWDTIQPIREAHHVPHRVRNHTRAAQRPDRRLGGSTNQSWPIALKKHDCLPSERCISNPISCQLGSRCIEPDMYQVWRPWAWPTSGSTCIRWRRPKSTKENTTKF